MKIARLLSSLHLFHRGERGFSLIELLVVMSILGSLTGVATLNVGKFTGTGEQATMDTEGDTVQLAALVYLADGNTISEPFTVSPSD